MQLKSELETFQDMPCFAVAVSADKDEAQWVKFLCNYIVLPVTMWSESNIAVVYWTFPTGLFLVKNYATTFQSMA